MQELYQFVFTKRDSEEYHPFSLFTTLPRKEIPLSDDRDLASSYSVKECTIMVEDREDVDANFFIDLLHKV